MHELVERTRNRFLALTRRYALFHTIFFVVFMGELLTLLLFLPFLAQSFWLATLVAAACLTAFSYFVLRFYFQTKKPEEFLAIREAFVAQAKKLYRSTDAPLSFLETVYQLIQSLEGQELQLYHLPSLLATLRPLMQKFSVWCHWSDIHLMKELLHTSCIKEQLELVKKYPMDIELHTTLANSYIGFYKIYQGPVPYSFIQTKLSSPAMVQKFQKRARCALEQLKIVLHYFPNHSWSLSQMAAIYHDLELKEEERKTYELLLEHVPHEKTVRFQLGVLYFQLGFMAQGLKIYDDLKKQSDPKADELIQYFDVFHSR